MGVWWRYAEGRDGLNQKGDWGETDARVRVKTQRESIAKAKRRNDGGHVAKHDQRL